MNKDKKTYFFKPTFFTKGPVFIECNRECETSGVSNIMEAQVLTLKKFVY